MDWKINLVLFLIIIFLYKLYSLNNQENFINNNISINNNIENTYGLNKRCDLENPKKVIPNELLIKSNEEQLYKNPKYNMEKNKGFQNTFFYKNKCVNKCINKCLSNCMNKYIDLDREILRVPLYIYPELYYHPLDEPL